MAAQLDLGGHSALPADADARARGEVRVSQLRERCGGSSVARRSGGQSRNRAIRRDRITRRTLGHDCLHVQRAARARRRRQGARDVPGGIPPRDGRPGGDSRHRRRQRSGSLGRRSRESGPSCDCDSVRTRRRGARSLRTTTSRLPVDAHRRHGPLGVEPGSPPAVRRRRARAFWLPRPPVSARHRRNGRGADPWFRTAGEGRRVLPRVTTTRAERRRRCPSRSCSRAMAAISPTCAWKSTSARSGISCGSNRRRRTSRNCWRRS